MTDSVINNAAPAFADKSNDEILSKVQKLLDLAAKNSNPEEAASAAAKAQELLITYNLSAEMLESATASKTGKRERAEVEGGFYTYQRALWRRVAELNFCLYWSQEYATIGTRRRYNAGLPPLKNARIMKRRHALVGKIVNTKATIAMAGYLLGAIERSLVDYLHNPEDKSLLFSDYAHGFREGAVQRIEEKLWKRRTEILAEEKRKQYEAAAKAAADGREGVSTSRTMTILALQDAEYDANIDFVYGEGTSAKWAAERAEAAAKRAREQAEYTAWAKANPEEAAAEEAIRRKASRSGGGRSSGGSSKRVNRSAYYAGYDAADAISLDQQVGEKSGTQKSIR